MRVISGEYGGRRLKAVPGVNTRPTTDKIKESIFNMIGPYFDGGVVLDLFAGSGGLSIEAVSRGYDRAILIDKAPQAIQTIKENIEITKEVEKFDVFRNDAKRAIQLLAKKEEKIDLLFLDPPYAKQEIVQQIEQMNQLDLFNHQAMIVCEVDKQVDLPEMIDDFICLKNEKYGVTKIVIYEKRA
ncbi:16S rRNA (guanine(966)-N(2))-methyltransferase RsmD [Isobaculum melis]|uniref:16S rRNA (Guanine966-N2)-methyltransferase n=1 Tax=Isobaculum melis TaxID=142588 RepID=A0A1H9RUK5_9LACT|nr:16S rRNA (guanine(966)-N(2))-methyltransferase RsmD [Isobaculum melis]SER76482.1 16S rRNA (guanine966-N2)-methyltransferase [Isobaculum melis]